MSLVRELRDALLAKNYFLAVAESCTGGMLASMLTALPGSSTWFERGFITYSNLAKQEMLGVNKDLILKQGAVSEAVAEAMALGALAYSAAHISVSITGIAGPDGGSPEKPVGTVCLAFAEKTKIVQSRRCYFPNASRKKIRMFSCQEALRGLLDFIHRP